MEDDTKAIEGFEDYAVTRAGEVLSFKCGPPKPLKIFKGSQGKYSQVCLSRFGKRHRRYVHRLIAEAFLLKGAHDTEVNHLDGNKQNNNASNLKWCSHKQNMYHAGITGLMFSKSK